MNRLFTYYTLFSAFSIYSASTHITKHSPLLSRKKPHVIQHKPVLEEISSMAERMYAEGKKLEELKEEFSSQETFAITGAYISSACPREALLTLYAEFLKYEKNNDYTYAIRELLASADKCPRCQ